MIWKVDGMCEEQIFYVDLFGWEGEELDKLKEEIIYYNSWIKGVEEGTAPDSAYGSQQDKENVSTLEMKPIFMVQTVEEAEEEFGEKFFECERYEEEVDRHYEGPYFALNDYELENILTLPFTVDHKDTLCGVSFGCDRILPMMKKVIDCA